MQSVKGNHTHTYSHAHIHTHTHVFCVDIKPEIKCASGPSIAELASMIESLGKPVVAAIVGIAMGGKYVCGRLIVYVCVNTLCLLSLFVHNLTACPSQAGSRLQWAATGVSHPHQPRCMTFKLLTHRQ